MKLNFLNILLLCVIYGTALTGIQMFFDFVKKEIQVKQEKEKIRINKLVEQGAIVKVERCIYLTAKCVVKIGNLSVGKRYTVTKVPMCSICTLVTIEGKSYPADCFEFFIDTRPVDIYKSVAFNPFISYNNDFIHYND